ncbi:MAG: T9SS C-terminal target domain-containing protein [Chitinophagaceae bacterium]|nr:MAG: T9SS C-terminal target domain-containing protein [Chitinophagaceae bacterium]
MKAKFLIYFLFIFLSGLYSKAQYLDGVLYLKVAEHQNENLDTSEAFISNAFNLLLVDTFYQPFEASSESNLRSIYRVFYSNNLEIVNALNLLNQSTVLDYAERAVDYQINFKVVPNDLDEAQWNLFKVNAPLAWQISTGSPDITIAIVDNGVLLSHEDLLSNIWINPGESSSPNGVDNDFNGYTDDINGYDVSDNNPNPNPPPGSIDTSSWVHGTHVAGIASAVTNNNTGIASLGYSSSIIAVKCAPDESFGKSLPNAYDGVFYAMQAGADIINMSFGSENGSLTSAALINAAYNSGALLIAAAGNDNTNQAFYPAAYPNVIAVGATDQNDMKASFSNYGAFVDVMAPGVGIYSSLLEGGNSYGFLSGTSMAAPHVAALAALVMDARPDFTREQVKNAILNGTDNIELLNPTYLGQLGSGRINAFKTLSNISSVNELLSSQKIKVYPNPFVSDVFVEMDDFIHDKIEVKLFDLKGSLIVNKIKRGKGELIQLAVPENISPGIYLLEVITENKHFRNKIIKSKVF